MINTIFATLFLLSSNGCETTQSSITGNSMQGLLWNKQEITIRHLDCEGFERFDHLVFSHSETPNAVIKQLWGVPGDTLTIAEDGSFYINDTKALTPFKRTYKLLGAYKTRFQKLAKEGPLKGYLVLGHPGSLDSARVGLIPKENLLGWVDKDEPIIKQP